MNVDQFAIWKFKNIEGWIDCNGYDFQTTKIVKDGKTYLVKYDLQKDTATISCDNDIFFFPKTVPFKDLKEELKKNHLWQERPYEERHRSCEANPET